MKKVCSAIILLLLFCARQSRGQDAPVLHGKNALDSAYVSTFYYRYYLIRVYESTKYNNFKLIDRPHGENVVYKSNAQNNLGIGFTYKFFGLNIGYPFSFMNPGKEKYGKTKKLDAQTHLYLHKYAIDFYGQMYKGYYLANPDDILTYKVEPNYPLRPDIRTRNFGLVFQYIFNHKKFSYRAAYVQNEIQKKSVGTWVAGAAAYYVGVQADSALLPPDIKNPNFFGGYNYNHSSLGSVSVNGGYAYTFVLKHSFFLMLSALGGAGVNYTNLSDQMNHVHMDKVLPGVNVTTRVALGYNSDRYFAGIHYIGEIMENRAPGAHNWQEMTAGNFRVSVARRFRLKRETLKKIDKVQQDVKDAVTPGK